MDSSGWLWMVRGFAKKLLLADTAAVFVDAVYASPADASGPAVLLATLLLPGRSTGTFPAIPTLPSEPLPCWVCD